MDITGSTGITSGPGAVTASTTYTINDPSIWGNPSTTVQVQNNSGFVITAYTSGAPYTIQPYMASTIPTVEDKSPIRLVTSAGVGNQIGNVTTIWMLDGQSPPMPDGALTSSVAISRNLQPTTTGGSTYLLQSTDVSMTISAWSTSHSGYVALYVNGDTSGLVYFSGLVAYATGAAAATEDNSVSFPVLGSLDASVTITLTSNVPNTVISVSASSQAINLPVQGYPTDVVPYGGSITVNGTISSSTGFSLLGFSGSPVYQLPSISGSVPVPNLAVRLHSLCCTGGASGQLLVLYSNYTSTQPYAVCTNGQMVMLDGLLIIENDVYAKSSAATTMAYNLTFDIISNPKIG